MQAPQYRQFALISDFVDLANLSMQEEAALATNWIKDRPEGLKLQNLALAPTTGPAVRSFLENTTADVQHAPFFLETWAGARCAVGCAM